VKNTIIEIITKNCDIALGARINQDCNRDSIPSTFFCRKTEAIMFSKAKE